MRLEHVALFAFAALLPAAPLAAQDTTARSALTLEEALATARRSNPAFQQTANNVRTADAQVRSAYGALMPSVGSAVTSSYQQGGRSFVSGAALEASSNSVSSSAGISVNYSVNGATLLNPRAARANREAVEADVTGAGEQLRAVVTQQYLTVLQAQARAEVQDTLVALNRAQLALAEARVSAGAATVLDVRRAEVALGQSEVQALSAHNTAQVELLRLFQQMGVDKPDSVTLTTTFNVSEPDFVLDSLLVLARAQHPAMGALRAREHASNVTVRARQSAYTPTLSLSTGWGGQAFGYTDGDFVVQQGQLQAERGLAACQERRTLYQQVGGGLTPPDCSGFVFTDVTAQQLRSSNDMWSFQKSPFSLNARVSLPIFDNFNRELSVQQAKVERDDVRHSLRARELQLTADVTQAYLSLRTAARTVALQEQISLKAREELVFAEERFKVGASTFLDVTTSRATYEQAQIDRINAIYDYHKAFAALENAVGRPLR